MYHKLLTQAKEKYGTSETRPQDGDKGMMVAARRNNLGHRAEPPPDFTAKIYTIPPNFQISRSDLKNINIVSQEIQWMQKEDLSVAVIPWKGPKVIAIDFEFHNQDTFDGK